VAKETLPHRLLTIAITLNRLITFMMLQPGAPELVKPYSRASYAGPSGSGYRPLAHRGGGLYPSVASSAAAADLDDAISIKSYPGAFVGGRTVTRSARRPLPSRNRYHVDDLEVSVQTVLKACMYADLVMPLQTNEPGHTVLA
jgi:hypothetical protein